MILENIQSWIELLRKKQCIWLKDRYKPLDDGRQLHWRGERTSSRLIKVGVNRKPSGLFLATLGERNQRGFLRVDKAVYPLSNKHQLHCWGGRPHADLSKVG
jgi:hypothetical protein